MKSPPAFDCRHSLFLEFALLHKIETPVLCLWPFSAIHRRLCSLLNTKKWPVFAFRHSHPLTVQCALLLNFKKPVLAPGHSVSLVPEIAESHDAENPCCHMFLFCFTSDRDRTIAKLLNRISTATLWHKKSSRVRLAFPCLLALILLFDLAAQETEPCRRPQQDVSIPVWMQVCVPFDHVMKNTVEPSHAELVSTCSNRTWHQVRTHFLPVEWRGRMQSRAHSLSCTRRCTTIPSRRVYVCADIHSMRKSHQFSLFLFGVTVNGRHTVIVSTELCICVQLLMALSEMK